MTIFASYRLAPDALTQRLRTPCPLRLAPLRLLLCSLLAMLLSPPAKAQPEAAPENVQAQLVSRSAEVQPGGTFHGALRLSHADTWHTYWKNPGDAGLATSLELQGAAVELGWPVPKVYLQQDIVNYVYEGVVLLPFTLEVPDTLQAGDVWVLEGSASWLECDPSQCIPGGAQLSLRVPLAASSEAVPLATLPEPLPVPMPEPLPEGWTASAKLYPQQVYLEVTAPAGTVLDGAQIYAFNEQAVTINALPASAPLSEDNRQRVTAEQRYQQVAQLAPNRLQIRSSISPYAEDPQQPLDFVLRYEGGWPGTDNALGLQTRVNPVEAVPQTNTSVELPGVGTVGTPQTGTPDGVQPQTTPQETRGLAYLLLLAFGGGLILNLMPCVFPVIGLKIMGFVEQAGASRRSVIHHGLAFTLGVLLSFWALAAMIIMLGQTWGFQMESPYFVLATLLFFFVFGLNMAGVFEVGSAAMSKAANLERAQAGKGLRSSFFSGLLATLVATPCSAPLLATALGATATLSPAANFAIFTAIALGLSLPYLLLSAFPGLTRRLPRPGPWMETLKQGLAFLLFGFVAYLAWTLAGQLPGYGHRGETALRDSFIVVAILGFAAWLYGRYTAPHKPRKIRRFAQALVLVISLAATAHAFAKIHQAQAQAAQQAAIRSGDPAALAAQNFLIWEDWSQHKVDEAVERGQPVYIDFTARWCATCQVNKRLYDDKAVIQAYLGADVLMLRADKTLPDPHIDAALKSYGAGAIPYNVLHLPGRQAPIEMPALLTKEALLKGLGSP
jgi:thiol:disulfide interchange protein DsbD